MRGKQFSRLTRRICHGLRGNLLAPGMAAQKSFSETKDMPAATGLINQTLKEIKHTIFLTPAKGRIWERPVQGCRDLSTAV
jgi:hypothetical protein